METSKVYVLCDSEGRIIRVEGGYTIGNIKDFLGWILVDEGEGDKYNLCQSNYLPKGLTEENGVYLYKLSNGSVKERTAKEIQADIDALPKPTPAPDITALSAKVQATVESTSMLEDCIAEMAEIVYA